MLYQNVQLFARSMRVIDSATLAVSAASVWYVGVLRGVWDTSTKGSMLVLAGCLAISFFLISRRHRVYHARRTEHFLRELTALTEVTVCAAGVSCLMAEVVAPGLPGTAYATIALAGIAAIIGTRVIIRGLLRSLRRGGKDRRTWLIVGRNQRSADIAEVILANPHFGIRIAQIVDVPARNGRNNPNRLDRFRRPPLDQLPQTETEMDSAEVVREVLTADVIDEVVVSLPVRSFYDEIERVLRLCGEAGISVKFPPQAFERGEGKTEVSRVGDIPLVTHFTGPSNYVSLTAKRLLDIVVAAACLVILLPVNLVVALAIKLTSPGPALFRQTRIGLHGRRFTMVKFRTMNSGAPQLRAALVKRNEVDWPAFKIRDDPRLTAVGRFLRKYHLDELPQLWNVLIGDMSLVGPRPMPLYAAEGHEWWQRRRNSVPPGITCLWQVEEDHKITFRKWMELDLEYIDRWSLWLDLRLLCATVRTVFRGPGW